MIRNQLLKTAFALIFIGSIANAKTTVPETWEEYQSIDLSRYSSGVLDASHTLLAAETISGEGIAIIDTATGTVKIHIPVDAWTYKFSPDSKRLLVFSEHLDSASVWNVQTGERLAVWEGHHLDGHFIGDTGRVFLKGCPSSICNPGVMPAIFDIASGDLVTEVPLGHFAKVSPNGHYLGIVFKFPRRTDVYDARKMTKLYTLNGHLATFSENSQILTMSEKGIESNWKASTGERIANFQVDVDPIYLAFDPTGRSFIAATGFSWNYLERYDSVTGQLIWKIGSRDEFFRTTNRFSHDGLNFLSINYVRDIENRYTQKLQSFDAETGAVVSDILSFPAYRQGDEENVLKNVEYFGDSDHIMVFITNGYHRPKRLSFWRRL